MFKVGEKNQILIEFNMFLNRLQKYLLLNKGGKALILPRLMPTSLLIPAP